MTKRLRHRLQRGVSLIEALVALAVMAIGMLGLMGVQTALRSNADVARQRSDAVRLAQAEIEKWRAFVSLSSAGAYTTYDGLASGSETIAPATGTGANTTFTRSWTITALAPPRKGKALSVEVSWTDRNGGPQRVQLATLIAGIAPELGGTLSVPGEGDVVRRPSGRNRGIPIQARDLGDGTSGFIPPGVAAGVAWRFDNVSGLITLCTTTATTTAGLLPANLTCGTDYRMLLAGFLRYALTSSAPAAANADNPDPTPLVSPPLPSVTYTSGLGGTVACLWENVTTPSAYTAYFCAIPVAVVPGAAPFWSGTLQFSDNGSTTMAPTLADTNFSDFKACRYYTHPPGYVLVSVPLINENYLVIRAGNQLPFFAPGTGVPFSCPPPTLPFQPLT